MSALYQYLDTVGDGSGTINFNGNYSSSQGVAKLVPPAGRVYDVARIIVNIEDGTGFTATKYGNLSALTNGLEISVRNAAKEILDITDGSPIKSNAHWGQICYDVELKSWGATPSNDMIVARFSFFKAGTPIMLNGVSGDFLQITFDDNLTGLVNHTFMAQGQIR